MSFPSLASPLLLVMWAQLLVVVVVARVFGSLMRRWGQPPVVGELLAGVVLGPSVFAQVWPAGWSWLFPHNTVAAAPLNAFGWLGVGLLLVLTGFETDLGLVRRMGKAATWVSAGGLLIPLGVGLLFGSALPSSFVGGHGGRLVFVLFIAVTLAITSLPVIAKILSELGYLRRNFGQITLAVGVVNDVIGWLALGILSGLASSGSLSTSSMVLLFGGLAVALIFAFTIGQRLIDRALRAARAEPSGTRSLAVTLVVTFLFATVFEAIHSDAVLGTFVAGMVVGRSRFQHPRVTARLESLTLTVLAPIFFVTAGLRLDLLALASPQVLVWSAALLVVAVFTKFAGAWIGGRLGGLQLRESTALGIGLNARGAVEVVIATIGLSLGALNEVSYTAVVLMAIITSVMAPPLLRLVVKDWRGGPDERRRLEAEEALEHNVVVRTGRLLLPSRGTTNSVVAARILDLVWPADAPVTILSLCSDGRAPDTDAVAGAFIGRSVEVREVHGSDHLATIVEEARLGYGVLGLGAADAGAPVQASATDGLILGSKMPHGSDHLEAADLRAQRTSPPSGGRILAPVVDELLGLSPIPLVVARQGWGRGRWAAVHFRRVLVAIAGTESSRAAQEIAFNLSRSIGTEVIIVHVVNRPDHAPVSMRTPGTTGRRGMRRQGAALTVDPLTPAALATSAAADQVTQQAVAYAQELGVEPKARVAVQRGASVAEEILTIAQEVDADLIVLGATARHLEGRAFLGHGVEQILERAQATVVVVSMPAPVTTGAGHDEY